MGFATQQERFWRGSMGDDYVARNDHEGLVPANTALFARSLRRVEAPASVLELGANIGLNLIALERLYPSAQLHAVEINAKACTELRRFLPDDQVTEGSLLEYQAPEPFDLVLIKGVLIHIAPEALDDAYRVAVESAQRYLLLCEYYNPTPVEVPYRGERERLFKRDFCGEILDRHPSMRLRDYGFAYHRDPQFPQDDLTWFLLERTD